MFFRRLFQRTQRTSSSYKPRVCVLEDRVVPAVLRGFGPPLQPANAATHLLVIVPQDVPEGTATNVVIEALTAKNQLATGYRGNVQIALANADPGAVLPADFTFSAADRGKHTLQVTFETAGPQAVVARSGGMAAQTPLTVASVATHFAVDAVSQATEGYPEYVQVVALDANGNIAADYRGTVQFTNTDAFAPQLDDYTFQPGDNGSHVFAVSFASPGLQTLTVTDAANRATLGAVSVNVSPNVGMWSPWSYPYYGGWGYGYGWLL